MDVAALAKSGADYNMGTGHGKAECGDELAWVRAVLAVLRLPVRRSHDSSL
jgi:hypothetical protein